MGGKKPRKRKADKEISEKGQEKKKVAEIENIQENSNIHTFNLSP